MNPQQPVLIRVSIGNAIAADGSQVPAYATPGAITASIGGTFTAFANGATLTVSAVLSGSLQAGDEVSGTDGTNLLATETTIVEQLTGTPGGDGTYELSVETDSGILNPCTVTSASTVLNVSAISLGVPQIGQTLADLTSALTPGTLITGLLEGTVGGPGLYSINQPQTVASEAMTASMTLLAQIQALAGGDLRHVDALNIQGSHKVMYIGAAVGAGVRPAVKGGDIATLPDGSVWLVTQNLEPFYSTARWQKLLLTLQDGS